MKKLDVQEVLRLNPQLDLSRVAKMEAFCAAATAAGIDLAPTYRIAPPLGELVQYSNQRLAAKGTK